MRLLNILLIEDDEADQILVKRSLKKAGIDCNLVAKYDSSNIDELLEAEDFDLIFLDYQLPDVDGITLLKQIRATKYIAPIIVITSHGDETIAVEAIRSGASDYITKNLLTPEGISQSIRTVLKAYDSEVEKNKGEEALKFSEKRFKELFLNAPVAIVIEDLETNKIVDVNNSACYLHNYERNELIGLSIFETIPPAYLEEAKIGYSTFLEKNLAKLESYCYTKNKEIIPIEIRISQIVYEDKNCNLLYMMDISERKKAQEALLIQQGRYLELIDNSGALLMTYGSNGKIITMNNQCLDTLNYSLEDVNKLYLNDLIITDKESEITLDEPLKTGNESRVLTVATSDGDKKHIMFNKVTRQEGGKDIVLCYGQDISERVAAENEMIIAKNLAEESVRLKQDFLANMSHEIRTPMNAILGFSDLLIKSNDNSEQKLSEENYKFVDNIKVSAENLIVVINDILDFSKMEAGKLTIEKENFDLYDLINSLENIIHQTFIQNDVELKFIKQDKLPRGIFGDPTRIYQVLINLINNSLKFTHRGFVHVKIEYDEKNESLYCEVEDSGIGISKDRLKLIFMSFAQAENNTTRKYGGTGLGLTISKNLVELMDGNISVISEEGKGSTFSFSIPIKLTQEIKDRCDLNEGIENIQLDKSVSILLVEDNPMNQLLAKKVLSDFGVSCDIANNGLEALDMFQKSSYDLILMDIQMPEMDGVTATKKLRREIKTEVPIIAMTAHAMKEEVSSFLDAGMNDHIAKPFKSNDLKYKIHTLLNKK